MNHKRDIKKSTGQKSNIAVKAMHKKPINLTAGIILLLSLLFSIPAHAATTYGIGTGTGKGGPGFDSALYRQNFTDMTIKIPGGHLLVERNWRDDHWTIGPNWNDLELQRQTKEEEPYQIIRGTASYLPVEGGGENTIYKNQDE